MKGKLGWKWQRWDKLMVAAIFLLMVFSLVVIYSLTFSLESSRFIFYKQLAVFVIGIILFIYFSSRSYNSWRNLGWFSYFLALFLLIAVLLFGQEVRNIRAWFVVGPISFQPVEIVKVLAIIFLASFFSRWQSTMSAWGRVAQSGILIGLLVFLIIKQPDWGSALLLLSIWGVLILFLPLKKWHIVSMIVIIVSLSIFSFLFVLKDYQRQRIINFINPTIDPLGSGYQSTQVKIAIGAGGLLGRGLGRGTQTQLRFLPEAHTDFIYAVIAEELGWLGAVTILVLFFIICLRLLYWAKIARTDFGTFLALGTLVYILAQATVNIGMNLGLLPITGIPLPLLSAGGSSLLAVFMALGIAHSIYIFDK